LPERRRRPIIFLIGDALKRVRGRTVGPALSMLLLAAMALVQIAQADPAPTPASPLAAAQQAYDKQDWDLAIADYTAAIRLAPGASYLYDMRGLSYWSANKFPQALQDFATAIQLDPNNHDARAHQKELRTRMLGEMSWTAPRPRWFICFVLLMGAAPVLFALLLIFDSRDMVKRQIDRCFVHAPDGMLIYYPRMVGKGYVVPDAGREASLRTFAKWLPWSGFIVVPIIVGLTLAFRRLHTPIPTWFVLPNLALMVFLLFFGISMRIATRGLAKTAEKRRIPLRERLRLDYAGRSRRTRWLMMLLLLVPMAPGGTIIFWSRSWMARGIGVVNVLFFGSLAWVLFSASKAAPLPTPSARPKE